MFKDPIVAVTWLNWLITKKNVAFFLISSMILGLLDQLQIFPTVEPDIIARAFNIWS